jgi:hypothetical protein
MVYRYFFTKILMVVVWTLAQDVKKWRRNFSPEEGGNG